MLGFLKRLLGKGGEEEGRWQVFLRETGFGPSFILFNEALDDVPPSRAHPNHLLLRVFMNNPSDNGFAPPPEGAVLDRLSNHLDHVEKQTGSLMAGRINGFGRHDYHFYVTDPASARTAFDQAMTRFRSHRYEITTDRDPEWNAYRDLRPTQTERRWISDSQVVQVLEQHGDRSETPRRIEHWAYFPDPSARDHFRQAVESQGFGEFEALDPGSDNDRTSFGLSFAREDPSEIFHIVQVTAALETLAKESGGEYDGWESPLVSG